jgi:hypothetical protein
MPGTVPRVRLPPLQDADAASRVLFAGALDFLVAANPSWHENRGPAGDDRRVDQAAVAHVI